MSRTEKLAGLVRTAGLDRLARLSWRGLLIFNYHRIGRPGEFDDPDLFSATQDDLDRQVGLLADRFEIVPAGAADLRGTRPARRIALTVDDGYRDELLAAEVFRARGVVGSFFVTTGFVDAPRHAWWDEIAWLARGVPAAGLAPSEWLPDGLDPAGRSPDQIRRVLNAAYKKRAGDRGEEFLSWLAGATGRERPDPGAARDRWMSWDDVRGLRRDGMEVGGHTVTHPILSTLDADAQRAEVVGSVQRLRAELGEPVDTFAYPVGAADSFDDRTRAALTEAGVRRAYSFCGGHNRPGGGDEFAVRRVGVFGESAAVVLATAALPGVLGSPRRYA
ncbi:MAG TPA: polysaccharide deacetylase family protein [Pseudonocardia sp.]|nr:polysaccharide deacetylase family protein [Pseudonocardia sp.]